MNSQSVQEFHCSADGGTDSIACLQDLIPSLSEQYLLQRAIGHGTFSRVYLAHLRKSDQSAPQQLAIKHIIPTSHPSRVYMELKCLHKLGGLHSVVGVWACHRHLNHIALAMPYFLHEATSDYMGCLTVVELRDYLANLLAAVRHVHAHGLLHRDVKPANFLYHRASNRYCLVDFGLAQEVGCQRSSVGVRRLPARPPTPLPPTPRLPALHPSSSRPVKRKLTSLTSSSSCSSVASHKRQKCSPPSVLSLAASRLNSALAPTEECVRRSPRKCLQRSPSTKENTPTPIAPSQIVCAPITSTVSVTPVTSLTPRKSSLAPRVATAPWQQLDSPSKHTRLAVSMRRCDQPPLSSLSDSGTVDHTAARTAGPPPKVKNGARIRPDPGGNNSSLTSTTATTTTTSTTANTTSATATTTTTSWQHNTTSSRPVSLTRPSEAMVTPGTGRRAGDVRALVESKSGGCRCYGRGQVCRRCDGRPQQVAARAGTPGFRPPEVLLRYPNQGTGVDVWACGVVGLCVTSGRHPFFRAPDDHSALAELCTLFSTRAVRRGAAALDKLFLSSVDCAQLSLRKVCETLRLSCVSDASVPETGPCSTCKQPRVCLCSDQFNELSLKHQSGLRVKQEKLGPIKAKEGTYMMQESATAPLVNYLSVLTKGTDEVKDVKSPGCKAPVGRISAADSPMRENAKHTTGTTSDHRSAANSGTVTGQCQNDAALASTLIAQSGFALPGHFNGGTSRSPAGLARKRPPRPPLYPKPYPVEVYSLLEQLLDLNPLTRITAADALKHPFLERARINQ